MSACCERSPVDKGGEFPHLGLLPHFAKCINAAFCCCCCCASSLHSSTSIFCANLHLSSSISSANFRASMLPPAMVGFALLKPSWLDSLLSQKFFVPCLSHLTSKKNERNIFCVDCTVGICPHCLPSHSPHRLLQIRRYVYHDVIRLQDIQKLVNCAQVQTYIINSARVVFLNQRPQPRSSKGLGNTCETCDRSLQDVFRFCSVACKVDAAFKHGKDLPDLLPRCNALHISDLASSSPADSLKACELGSEDHLSPTSVMEAASSPTSSGSTSNQGIVWGKGTATMPPPKRICAPKLAKDDATTSPLPSSFSRRKGKPHRSPLC